MTEERDDAHRHRLHNGARLFCECPGSLHSFESLHGDELVDAQLGVRWSIVLTVALVLSACTPDEASPSPSPSQAGFSFEEYRQANLEYVRCAESHGATVTVEEVDSFGVPDLANSVAWPKLTAEIGTPEYDDQLAQIVAWDDECESSEVQAARQAYWTSGGRSALQEANRAKRWEEMLPIVRECFARAGASVDANATRDELMAVYRTADDTVTFDQCLIDARLVTDLGDGAFQVDS